MQAARTDIRGHSSLKRELEGGRGRSRPRWSGEGFSGWKKVLGGCGWSVLERSPVPANLANIREVVRLPMTWACCTHRGEEDRLHVPPGGLTGLNSAQHWEESLVDKDKQACSANCVQRERESS